MRYTTRNGGKARIKNMQFLPEAMEKLARIEDIADNGCKGCDYEHYTKALYPCRLCTRNKADKYKRS